MHKKVQTLDGLSDVCGRLRSDGKRIAHCHGAFDLIHPGHIRHLQAAKAMADVLVVTLTEDRFIRKGPGRPVFNERLRVGTIAALDCVDFVATSPWPTAVETLELLKPTFYVKGMDYKDQAADVTGAITHEEQMVSKMGGKLVFTDEIQYSSTKLLNEHFSVLNVEQKQYLTNLQEKFSAADVLAQLDALRNLRVLIVGEAIIDEYHYCQPDAMSNKSPTISARFESSEIYAGGVDAVGSHLLELAGSVHILAGTGVDDCEKLPSNGQAKSISRTSIQRPDAPTVRKRRFVHRFLNQKLFEVTFLDDRPIPKTTEDAMIEAIDELAPKADVVIAVDFGHGFFTLPVVQRLREKSKFLAVNAQINSSNRGFNTIRKYQKPDYISIDEHEIRLPFGDRYGSLKQLIRTVADELGCERINVTLGTQGTMYYDGSNFFPAPIFTNGVVDAMGAGDALLAITSMLVCNKAPSQLIPFIGNCMGGLMTQIVGHRSPVEAVNLRKFVGTLMK